MLLYLYSSSRLIQRKNLLLAVWGIMISATFTPALQAAHCNETTTLLTTSAERKVIRGQVLDEHRQPLPHAAVTIIGTNVTTETNKEGIFKLALSTLGKKRLRVSHLGYQSQSVDIHTEHANNLSIQLRPAAFDVPEAVVTGSRSERPLKDMPVITRVISRSEIDRVNPLDMQGLLQYTLPGIQFRYNSMSQTSTMTYQGMNSKMLLFLIDGERLSGESSDHNIDYNRINIDDIERIEVVRGAASTLYDSNAQGGVINIITKKAKRPISLQLHGRYAGNHGEKYGANLGIKRDRWSSQTTFGQRSRKTFYAVDDRPYYFSEVNGDSITTVADSSLMTVPLYGYNVWDVAQRFSYNFNEHLSAEVKGAFYSNVRPQRPDKKHYERYEDFTLSARMKYIFNPDQFVDLSYVVDDYAKRAIYPAISLTETPYQHRQHTTRLNYTGVFGAHTLSFGQEIRQEYLTHYFFKNNGSKQGVISSLYMQEDWRISPRLHLVAGLRADKATDYDMHLTPKLSLLYRLEQGVTLRANYSHGYRPPTLKERFQEFNMLNIMHILGNPDLLPETSRQVSASLEWEWDKTHVTASTYHNRYHNYISYTQERPDALRYINTDDRRTTGVELSLRHRLGNNLLLTSTYNFVDDHDQRDGYNLSTVRPHAITFSTSYRHKFGKNLIGNFSLNGHWGSRFKSYQFYAKKNIYKIYTYDARTYCSLQCSAQLPQRGMTVGFMIDNLFDFKDKATTALVQLPDAGRSFVVTLSIDMAELLKW